MKTCISTYSYWRYISSGQYTFFDAVNKTAELGAEGLELFLPNSVEDNNLEEFVKMVVFSAREKGLEIPIYTVNANLLQADTTSEMKRIKRHIDNASANGIQLLRHDIGGCFYEGYTGDKSFETALELTLPLIRELTDYAESKGVMTCSENHGRIFQHSTRMNTVFKTVDRKNYRLLCDVGNFGGVDEDCASAVSNLLPYIVHVHIKDAFLKSGMSENPGRGWNKTQCGNYRRATIVGHGDVPVKQCVSTIAESGYNGFYSIEFEGIEDNVQALEIGLENLKRFLSESGVK